MDLDGRRNHFVNAFVSSVEQKFIYWQKYLQGCPEELKQGKLNEAITQAILAAPFCEEISGDGIKHEQAKRMTNIILFSANDQQRFRTILCEAAYEIFCHYENQFDIISCKGEILWAMWRLGSDSMCRLMSYLFNNKIEDFTANFVAQGVVLGTSPMNNANITKYCTLTLEAKPVTTSNFFDDPGVYVQADTCYKKKATALTWKLRLRFEFETLDYIKSNFPIYRKPYSTYVYQWENKQKLEEIKALHNFIIENEELKQSFLAGNEQLENLLIKLTKLQTDIADGNNKNHCLTRKALAQMTEFVILYLWEILNESFRNPQEREKRESRQTEQEDRRYGSQTNSKSESPGNTNFGQKDEKTFFEALQNHPQYFSSTNTYEEVLTQINTQVIHAREEDKAELKKMLQIMSDKIDNYTTSSEDRYTRLYENAKNMAAILDKQESEANASKPSTSKQIL